MAKVVELRPGNGGGKRKGKGQRAPAGEGAATFGPLDRDLSFLPRNDVGNAQRLIRRVDDEPEGGLLYVRGVGWAGWDGRRWSTPDGAHLAQLAAQRTAAAMRAEVDAFAERVPDEAEVEKYARFAVGAGNSTRIRAMLDQAEPHLAVNVQDMDRDRRRLNVLNGTLLLRDSSDLGIELVPHERAHRITRLVPVAYDPEARCPRWEAFLAKIQPDPEVRQFLQRWFGYCLTGEVSAESFVIFWGKGRNGKGVLTETVLWVQGDYGQTIPIASLMEDSRRRGSEPTPDIARLPGARAVFAGEPDMNMGFAEGLVKTLTGGDTITARNLNQPFFDFEPHFKITISCNPRPNVKGLDDGIWRRIHLVPFEVQIPLAEVVPKPEMLAAFREEGAGILNWLLDGFQAWCLRGLDPPKAILAATEEYREDSNPLGRFLRNCAISAPSASVPAADLYAAFCKWCVASGLKPWSQTAFGRRMTDMGYERQTKGTVSYLGLRLEEEWQPRPREHGHGGGGDYGDPPAPEAGDPGPMPAM